MSFVLFYPCDGRGTVTPRHVLRKHGHRNFEVSFAVGRPSRFGLTRFLPSFNAGDDRDSPLVVGFVTVRYTLVLVDVTIPVLRRHVDHPGVGVPEKPVHLARLPRVMASGFGPAP